VDTWGIPYKQVEWRFLRGRRGPRVLRILCERELFVPVVLLRSTEDSEILFKHLVGSLTCSVCLRVICRTDVLMDVEKSAEFGGEFRCEADISV
jgi:hypothetical protein